jgi:hypothetical protein
MSQKLAKLLVVLAATAVVCGLMIAVDVGQEHGPATERARDTSHAVPQPADSSDGGVVRGRSAVDSSVQAVIERSPRFATGTAESEYYDLLSRLLESERELEKLLKALAEANARVRELEEALGRVPVDEPGPATADEIAAIEALRRAKVKDGADFRSLMDAAEQFIEQYPRSPLAGDAKRLFEEFARAWDYQDYQSAREFWRSNPENFAAQVARFQSYIDNHVAAGSYLSDARSAISRIRAEWADHEYRQIHEFATRYPSDLAAVATRARRFLDEHPASRYRAAAEEFLARYEVAATPREYRVRVKSGSFAHTIGRTMSSGPDLAVEIEVAGVRVGRTPIVADSFDPVWNYEFPQSIRWRLGDSVRIRVIEFDYSNRTVLKIEPPADDPLAMRYLTGTIKAEGHQLVFESDFHPPTLPAP